MLSLALCEDTQCEQANLSGARVCLGGACGLLLGGGLLLRKTLGGDEARGLCVGVRGDGVSGGIEGVETKRSCWERRARDQC